MIIYLTVPKKLLEDKKIKKSDKMKKNLEESHRRLMRSLIHVSGSAKESAMSIWNFDPKAPDEYVLYGVDLKRFKIRKVRMPKVRIG